MLDMFCLRPSRGSAISSIGSSLAFFWTLLRLTSGATLSRTFLGQIGAQEEGIGECSRLADASHCGYYSCLDRHLSCHGFFHSFGHRFCLKVENDGDTFPHRERAWLKKTNDCILRTMEAQVSEESPCSTRGLSVSALRFCLNDNSICDMMSGHKNMLHRVFSRQRFLTLIQAASHCPQSVVNNYIHWAMKRMHLIS